MEQPPLFEFHLYRGRYRGRPVHPLGWLAMFGAILAPHLGWLLLPWQQSARRYRG